MGTVYSAFRPFVSRPGEPVVAEEPSKPKLPLPADDAFLLHWIVDSMRTVEEIGPIRDVDTGVDETSEAEEVLEPSSQGPDSTANASFSMSNGIHYPYCILRSPLPENDLKAKLEKRVRSYGDSEVRRWMYQAISHLFDCEPKIVRFLKGHDNPQLLNVFVEHLNIVLTAASCRGTENGEGDKTQVPGEGEQWGMAFLDGFKQWNRIIQFLVDTNEVEQVD